MTIKQKQCLLTYLGYDTGGVDGIWGEKSRDAIKCAQEDLGIPADSVWGSQTEAAVLEAVYTYKEEATVETDTNVGSNDQTGSFWDHIRYWTREEFRCRCGEYHAPYCNGFPVEPDQTLVELLDDLRAYFGRPGHRSSGIRCRQHNADQPGSAANSKHLYGKAMDFFIEGVSGPQLLARIKADPRTNYAYIIEGQYVHVDVK